MKQNRTKLFLIIGCVMAALLFAVLNLYIPKVIDDYPYSRSFVGVTSPADDQNIHGVITSFSDLVRSQVVHYQYINGRFIVHTLVQLFCTMWGKPVFDILQGFFMLLWLYAASKVIGVRNRMGRLLPTGAVPLLLMLFFFRDPSCIYHGVAYGINYMWASALCLLFLALLQEDKVHMGVKGLLAFLVGSSNEAFALPIAGAMVLRYLFDSECRSRRQSAIIFFMLIGVMTILASPANYMRLHDVRTTTDGTSVVFNHLQGLASLRIIYLWVMVLMVRSVIFRDLKVYLKENLLLVLIIVMTVMMVIGIGGTSLRQGAGGELAASLLLSRMLFGSHRERRNIMVGVYSTSVLLLFLFGLLFLQIPQSERFHEADRQIAASQARSVVVTLQPTHSLPPQLSKYLVAELSEFQLSQFAWWYEKESVIVNETEMNQSPQSDGL